MRLLYNMKSNLYSVFVLKCVSITNVIIKHYMEVLLDNKKHNKQKIKNTFFERFYRVVFKFFIQNIIYDKIMLFDTALLVQNTQRGKVMLNKVLSKSGLM